MGPRVLMTWSEDMQAMLRGRGLWRLVSKQEKCHRLDPNKQEEWDDKADRVCRVLTLGVEQPQQVHLHFQTVKDNLSKYGKLSNPHTYTNDQARDSMPMMTSSQSEKRRMNPYKPSWPDSTSRCSKCKLMSKQLQSSKT